MREILTPKQMGACDAYTIAQGTPGAVLMEKAGDAVAQAAMAMARPDDGVLVLAGPGNNGGDGYVAARLLRDAGYDVQVAALGEPAKLSSDARWAYEGWGGEVLSADRVDDALLGAQGLVIDGLFGAGLTRALEGTAAALVERINAAGRPVLAIDLPSGLDGATGKPAGPVIRAGSTVTFHRFKPAHVLYAGRGLCGTLSVADIGLHADAITQSGFIARLTGPYLWDGMQSLGGDDHKYARGHALVVGGPPDKAGAGFLAASAALRAGAGLVTLAAPHETLGGSIGQFPALMRARCSGAQDLAGLLSDARLSICALGPGLPANEATWAMVYAALDSAAALVLDAGALSAFAGMAPQLFERISARDAPVVLTPHAGEFKRLFGEGSGSSKIEIAQNAAQESGAVVVLKGADSVIAHPCAQAACTYVNANAPACLATAGSGDVLTGIIAGLLAQAPGQHEDNAEQVTARIAAAVWLHGQAGREAGPALIASDLEPALRTVLRGMTAEAFTPLQAP